MKKSISKISTFIAFIMLFVVMLAACNTGESDEPTGKYKIMYSDGAKAHKIEVEYGDVYSIDTPLPSMFGYDFMGLYDAEVGGTQYVSSSGVSVSPFNDRRNIVLYPRFEAKKYNLILDYGEANSTGVTSVTVEYDAKIPVLPGALTISDKYFMNFTGWYTKENCKGTMVGDSYGNSTISMNAELANLSDESRNIKLYAGFAAETYTVKLYSDDGKFEIKSFEIAHGTLLSDVVNNISDRGIRVLSWCEYVNGTPINTTNFAVEGNLNLYAKEYGTSALATFEERTKQRITDDGVAKNYADTINVDNLFGRRIQEFIDLGFNKIRFDITVSISEINRGYQEIYISTTRSSDGVLWKKTNIEHGGAIGVTSSSGNHSYSATVDLLACKDTLFILYNAHGDAEDDWNRHAVVLKMEIYKV